MVKKTHTVIHPKYSLHKFTENNQANDIFKYITQEKLSEANTCQTVKILLFFTYILSSMIRLNSSSRGTDIVQSIFLQKSENAASCYVSSVIPLYGKDGMDVPSLRVLRLGYQMHLYSSRNRICTGNSEGLTVLYRKHHIYLMTMKTAVKADLGRWAANVLNTLKPEKLSVRFWQTRAGWYFSNFTKSLESNTTSAQFRGNAPHWCSPQHQGSPIFLPRFIITSCTPTQTWGLLCNMTTAHYKHYKPFRKKYFG